MISPDTSVTNRHPICVLHAPRARPGSRCRLGSVAKEARDYLLRTGVSSRTGHPQGPSGADALDIALTRFTRRSSRPAGSQSTGEPRTPSGPGTPAVTVGVRALRGLGEHPRFRVRPSQCSVLAPGSPLVVLGRRVRRRRWCGQWTSRAPVGRRQRGHSAGHSSTPALVPSRGAQSQSGARSVKESVSPLRGGAGRDRSSIDPRTVSRRILQQGTFRESAISVPMADTSGPLAQVRHSVTRGTVGSEIQLVGIRSVTN